MNQQFSGCNSSDDESDDGRPPLVGHVEAAAELMYDTDTDTEDEEEELADSGFDILFKSILEAERQLQSVKEWTSSSLPVEFAVSLEDDTPCVINVIDTFGKAVRETQKKKVTSQKHWLPAHLNKNTKEFRAQNVLGHFHQSALAEGVSLRIKSWNKPNRLVFQCIRSEAYKETKPSKRKTSNKKINKVFTTSKAVWKEERCPFNFHIKWDEEVKRWYLPEAQMGNNHHKGHLKRMPDITRARIDDLPESEKKLLGDLGEANTAIASQENLILQRNNFAISKERIQYFRKKQQEIAHDARLSEEFGSDPMTRPRTPADRLIASMDKDKKLSYVAVYAEFHTDRLTIKKKCKFRQQHTVKEVDPAEHGGDVSTLKIDAEKMRLGIREKLRVTSQNDKILLAFAWTDDESKLRFDMFPEVVAADCTNHMNREERPVMLFSGLDSNNKTFSHTWVFMPAESKWAFRWVIQVAMPTLHNQETLDNVQLFLTDQDEIGRAHV